MNPDCSIVGCYQRRRSRGWCQTHYHRWLRHGDPTYIWPARPIHSSPTAQETP